MVQMRHGAPAGLWQALVHEAGERAGFALDESRESYLVFVLLRHQGDGQLLVRMQGLDWLHAQAQSGATREESLREVGDRCLLIAGLFPALAERRRVNVRYYMDIGRSAYLDIADSGRSAYAAMFRQLATGYEELVRTLRAVRPDMIGVPVDYARFAQHVPAPPHH
jgi:hypothetical protein